MRNLVCAVPAHAPCSHACFALTCQRCLTAECVVCASLYLCATVQGRPQAAVLCSGHNYVLRPDHHRHRHGHPLRRRPHGQGASAGMLVLICAFLACFAFSWGPLGWLVSHTAIIRRLALKAALHCRQCPAARKPAALPTGWSSVGLQRLLSAAQAVCRCLQRCTPSRLASPVRLQLSVPTSWPRSSSVRSLAMKLLWGMAARSRL